MFDQVRFRIWLKKLFKNTTKIEKKNCFQPLLKKKFPSKLQLLT